MTTLPNLQKDAKWDRRDWHAFRNLALGGILAGGGAGAFVSLQRQINALRERAEQEKRVQNMTMPVRILRPADPEAEPTIPLEPDSQMAKQAGIIPGGAGLALGIVGGKYAYDLVRKLHERERQKDIEQLLRDAQEGYEQALLERTMRENPEKPKPGQVKRANMFSGDLPGTITGLGWAGIAASPLLAYIAHQSSRRVLDKAFPEVDVNKLVVEQFGGRPIRIEEVQVPLRKDQEPPRDQEEAKALQLEDEALQKRAGVTPLEHLGQQLGAWLLMSGATDRDRSETYGWIKAAAHQPHMISRLDPTTSLRDMRVLREGAPDVDFLEGALVARQLLKSARVGQQFAVLIASELAESMPRVFAESLGAPDGLVDRSVKCAALMSDQMLDQMLLNRINSIPPRRDALDKMASLVESTQDKVKVLSDMASGATGEAVRKGGEAARNLTLPTTTAPPDPEILALQMALERLKEMRRTESGQEELHKPVPEPTQESDPNLEGRTDE